MSAALRVLALGLFAISVVCDKVVKKTEKSSFRVSIGHAVMAIFGAILVIGMLLAVIFKDRNKPFQVPIENIQVV